MKERKSDQIGRGFSTTKKKTFRLLYCYCVDPVSAIRHTLRTELPGLSYEKSHTASAESGKSLISLPILPHFCFASLGPLACALRLSQAQIRRKLGDKPAIATTGFAVALEMGVAR